MKLLSAARDLKRRRGRERSELFVVEGVRGVEELLGSTFGVHGVLASDALYRSGRGEALAAALERRGVPLSRVTEREFGTASQTEAPQGVLAIASIPKRTLDNVLVGESCTILVLDGIQDPGNVGTILRTAAALGAVATVALPGTVDIWNAKVVRSAMGAHYSHFALHSTLPELLSILHRDQIALWCSEQGGAPPDEWPEQKRVAVVFGNEGVGVSHALREHASLTVGIPLGSAVESLNVAVAAGIVLYELGWRSSGERR